MRDGLYRVEWKNVCAGFVVAENRVIACAPVLRKKFRMWYCFAEWLCP